MTRWFGVGRCESPDSYAAGAVAARAALAGPDPKLLLVFAAISHDLAALQAGVQDVAGPVPVIGCTTHGEIGPGGPRDASVTVAALGGGGFFAGTGPPQEGPGPPRQARAKVAEEAHAGGAPAHLAMTLGIHGLLLRLRGLA